LLPVLLVPSLMIHYFGTKEFTHTVILYTSRQ